MIGKRAKGERRAQELLAAARNGGVGRERRVAYGGNTTTVIAYKQHEAAALHDELLTMLQALQRAATGAPVDRLGPLATALAAEIQGVVDDGIWHLERCATNASIVHWDVVDRRDKNNFAPTSKELAEWITRYDRAMRTVRDPDAATAWLTNEMSNDDQPSADDEPLANLGIKLPSAVVYATTWMGLQQHVTHFGGEPHADAMILWMQLANAGWTMDLEGRLQDPMAVDRIPDEEATAIAEIAEFLMTHDDLPLEPALEAGAAAIGGLRLIKYGDRDALVDFTSYATRFFASPIPGDDNHVMTTHLFAVGAAAQLAAATNAARAR